MLHLPFTTEQFLEVFKNYNLAVWPMQIMLTVMALFMVILGTRTAPVSDKAISWMLAFLWLWMGVMYHFLFFAAINPAAKIFGALFVLQGVLFAQSGGRIVFHYRKNAAGITGAILMGFALLVYPVWGYFRGHIFPSSPTFGLPCPTTIFTLGMLLWSKESRVRYLTFIPLLWSLVGFSAAFSLGIVEDTGLLVAGIATALVYFSHKRSSGKGLPAHS